MKWGKKKPTSPSPSSMGYISHIFPTSWFSRFKHMGVKPEASPSAKVNKNLPTQSSSQHASCSRNVRFYGQEKDDDAFWRLSFGEENVYARKSRGGNVSDEGVEIPASSSQSCRSSTAKRAGKEESHQRFSNMVSDIGNMRELVGNLEVLPDNDDSCKREKESKETEFKLVRKKVAEERESRKTNSSKEKLELQRKSDKAEEISMESIQEEILKLEPVLTIRTTEMNHPELRGSGLRRDPYLSSIKTRNLNLGTIKEDSTFAEFNLNLKETNGGSAEAQNLKDMKIKELMTKDRKSLYITRDLQRKRRTLQSGKVRAKSPRTPSKVEVCKIKAIEDMKKAKMKMKMKMKMKKKKKEKAAEERKGLESFAVVKSSFDPQQDFRDSMVEMIMEKGITRPEELEELLACYLTLNSNEYHDLIIKVFRQVWFELNHTDFDHELPNETLLL